MAITGKMPAAASVDEYIKRHPANVQAMLKQFRKTIKATAPMAEEVISYQIPGYKYHGMLVFFAAWKNHISLYPAPWGAEEFKKDFAGYKGSKGTVQFPLDKPVPSTLIKKIVKYWLKQNIEKANAKKAAIKKPVAKASRKKSTNK